MRYVDSEAVGFSETHAVGVLETPAFKIETLIGVVEVEGTGDDPREESRRPFFELFRPPSSGEHFLFFPDELRRPGIFTFNFETFNSTQKISRLKNDDPCCST